MNQNHPEHLPAVCAQRDTHSDFMRPVRNRVRDNPVHSDRRRYQGQRAERRKEKHRESGLRQGLIDQRMERRDLGERQIRVDRVHGFPDARRGVSRLSLIGDADWRGICVSAPHAGAKPQTSPATAWSTDTSRGLPALDETRMASVALPIAQRTRDSAAAGSRYRRRTEIQTVP